MIFLRDALELTDTRTTEAGFMAVNARPARTGVQYYMGAEVERPDLPVAAVYRPADEVFRKDSLATFANKPVTDDHPKGDVTAQNWRDLARGFVGNAVARDGELVQVPMLLTDAELIGKVNDGKHELSAGYQCMIDWTPGTSPEGVPFHGTQRDIKINHVAIVDAGRAGSQCRIGDTSTPQPLKETPSMTTNPALQAVLIDGVTVHVDATAAQLIAKQNDALSKAVADALAARAAIETGKAEAQKQLDAKAGEIAAMQTEHKKALDAKDGEITALKSQVLDSAGIEAKAAERAELVTVCKAILGDSLDPKGKSDSDLRKLAVEKALGDDAKTLTSEDQINGAFSVIAKGKGPVRDGVRDGFLRPGAGQPAGGYAPQSGQRQGMADTDAALNDMKKRMESAWTVNPSVPAAA